MRKRERRKLWPTQNWHCRGTPLDIFWNAGSRMESVAQRGREMGCRGLLGIGVFQGWLPVDREGRAPRKVKELFICRHGT